MKTAWGTAEANRRYCTKEDEFYEEWGVPSKSKEGQGKRNDWLRIHTLAQSQAPTTDFLEAVPSLAYQHISKISQWRQAWAPPLKRTEPTRPIILFGPPGSGKSTYARILSPDGWEKGTRDAKGWNGYDGVSDIIINEMDGGWFRYSDLKNFLDRGVFNGECKYGGFVTVCAKRCIMTTNDHPATWYKECSKWDSTNALRRRIKEFGELWIFKAPVEHPDGSVEWFAPTRDLELKPPAEAEVPASYSSLVNLN